MSPSETEDDKKVHPDPEPLCLFYYPRPQFEGKDNETYLSSTRGTNPSKTQKLAEGQRSNRGHWKLPPVRRTLQQALSSSDEITEKITTRRKEAVLRRVPISKKQGGIRSKETHQQRKSRTRRFGREPVRNLTSYLLSSVQTPPVQSSEPPPPLVHVLDTITDAWPDARTLKLYPNQALLKDQDQKEMSTEAPCHILTRRRSVPEELIRKFSVSKERTSESEANATMPEVTSPSSKESEEVREKGLTERAEEARGCSKLRASVFSQKIEEDNYTPVLHRSFRLVEEPGIVYSAEEGSSDSDCNAPGMERMNTIKRAPHRRGSVMEASMASSENTTTERASQSDYYRTGQGILKLSAADKSSQTGDCTCRSHDSGTTASAQEDTESAESSGTISSPRMCTQPLSSSNNRSSESEEIECTCADLTSSKDTSTDPNHSGKSTLSQTVSDKSTSTQDSTASVNSVSSRGSTITAATDSSSTDVDPRTSAKETTTSPDHTPRSPTGRRHIDEGKNRSAGNGQRKQHSQEKHRRHCPHHASRGGGHGAQKGSRHQAIQANFQTKEKEAKESKVELVNSCKIQTSPLISYEWTQLSEEELCLIQQQRQKRFIENNRNLYSPLSTQSAAVAGKVSVYTSTASSYYDTSNLGTIPMVVPRYSALPKTMSMVVNSSFESSQNYSDSDSQSCADSLEDGHNRHEPIYHDTRNELKPVRGDIELALADRNKKIKNKEPRGRAYFFAVDDDGGAELVTNIHKIPEVPEGIKKKIHERYAKMCKSHETKEQGKELPSQMKTRRRLIKRRSKVSKPEEETRCQSIKHASTPLKENKHSNPKKIITKHSQGKEMQEHAQKEKVTTRFSSKIPTLVQQVVSLKERSIDKAPANECQVFQEIEKRQEDDVPRKPQAVIHPSQPMLSNEPIPTSTLSAKENHVLSSQSSMISMDVETSHSLISSLESTATVLRAQKSTQRRPQPAPKRSFKFQQRFEMIPEERSSSLTSSAEDHQSEKNRRRSLPVKLSEPTNSPNLLTSTEHNVKSFRRYTLGSLSNSVIAQLMGRPLQAIPCVQRGPNNENQQIIIFSPKDSPGHNSSKGRDALLAMNREDFNRLTKGWMNFYLLKENSDSENTAEDDAAEEGSATGANTNNEAHEIISENNPFQEANALVCRLPSMSKDPPTTSGSGTDTGTCTPPGPLQLDPGQESKSYSLLLKNPETNCFQLQECPNDTKDTLKNNLNVVTEILRRENKSVKVPTEDKIMVNSVSKHKGASKEVNETLQEETPLIGQTTNAAPVIQDINSSHASKSHPIILTKEASTITEKKYDFKNKHTKEIPIQLSAPLKLGSSNTVLTTQKTIAVSPRKPPKPSNRSCSLPELRGEQAKKASKTGKPHSQVDYLPRVGDASSGSDDSDSDSTVYMNIPSPQIPRLTLDDCCDCCSEDSSSGSQTTRTNAPVLPKERQYIPLRRRPLPFRPKNRFGFYESVHGKKPGSGWSVTVEGTLAFPRMRPDVQMKLSFPQDNGPPFVSQSDSGFVEDHQGKSRSSAQQKQLWTVTVKNPPSGIGKEKHKPVCHLPNLSQQQIERSTKRGAKKISSERVGIEQEEIKRKLSMIWPKVQEVIENELKTITEKLITDDGGKEEDGPLLSVEGRAMSFDTKPRVTKMSERDLTRNNTARSDSLKRAARSCQIGTP